VCCREWKFKFPSSFNTRNFRPLGPHIGKSTAFFRKKRHIVRCSSAHLRGARTIHKALAPQIRLDRGKLRPSCHISWSFRSTAGLNKSPPRIKYENNAHRTLRVLSDQEGSWKSLAKTPAAELSEPAFQKSDQTARHSIQE
jgi:hypothetical protein